MNFTKIGSGADRKTKKGNDAIILTLDPEAQKRAYKEDFEAKIWLFKHSGGWTVCCPMPDDYEYVETKR